MPNLIIPITSVTAGGHLIGVDLYLKENHQRRVKVTDYPVEDGSSRLERAALLPDTLILQGAVTNFQGIDRPEAIWNELLTASADRRPVICNTFLRYYDNMMIYSVDSVVDSESGYGLVFDLGLREIVTAGVTQGGRRAVYPSAPIRVGTVNRGSVATKEVDAGTADSVMEQVTPADEDLADELFNILVNQRFVGPARR